MADILIRGMGDIPVGQEFVIVENIDFERYLYNRETGAAFHLISLPEGHGRLIDADALIDALETQDYSCAPDTLEDWTPQDMTVAEIADITHAPTIVPAEGGTDDG